MREITDEEGGRWEAIALARPVAHLKEGRVLAFRRVDEPQAPPRVTAVTFNGERAAASAIRTMSEKELRRRLDWARHAGGDIRRPLL